MKIEEKLQSIANILLLNLDSFENLGLINGKTGAAIFFYHYIRSGGNKYYETIADDLIDDIYKKINVKTGNSFFYGLSGIGWAMEYLVKSHFAEADTDDVLEETDKIIFTEESNGLPLSTEKKDIYGQGLYLVSRLGNTEESKNKIELLNKRPLLNYLFEHSEKLLNNPEFFTNDLPEIELAQLNSILYFLIEIKKSQLFSIDIQQIINHLVGKFIEKGKISKSLTDRITFKLFAKELNKLIPGNNLNDLSEKIENPSKSDISMDDKIDAIIKAAWYEKFYRINYLEIREIQDIAKPVIEFIGNEENWYNVSMVDKKDLAGLGFFLINYKNRVNNAK